MYTSTASSDATTGCIDVLRVKSSLGRGGYIRNIHIQNVRVWALRNSLGGRGKKHPDVFRFEASLEGSGTPVSNLTVQDNVMHVAFAAGRAGQFYGSDARTPIRGLRLLNVTIANSSGGWICRNVVS